MRKCSTCKLEKVEIDFHKDKNRCDGIAYECKDCRKIRGRSSCVRSSNKRATAKYRVSEHGQEIRKMLRKIYATSEGGREIKRHGVRHRRELKRDIDMNYSVTDERATRILFGNLCFKCNSKHDLQIDHHYPLSIGFGLSPDNAVLLCGFCNNSKNNRLPETFYCSSELERLNYLLALASI